MERANLYLIRGRRLVFAVVVIFFNFCCHNCSAEPEKNWDLVKEKNGIRIYNCTIEKSPFKPYKGEMTIESTLSALVCLVMDAKSYPEWVETCILGKTLEKTGNQRQIMYTVNEAPWPVSDRDSIVESEIVQNKKSGVVHISLTGLPNYLPERKKLVRVEKINGFWRFIPLKRNRAKVVYQVHTEPGGNLPSWLVNSVVVNQPFQTLGNMRKIVKQPKYHNCVFKEIDNTPAVLPLKKND